MTVDAQFLKQELRELQNLVTEDFSGVIWLTRGELSSELPYFSALDYLVNGALQQLVNNRMTISQNLVMAKNFGHAFFVAQFSASEEIKKIESALTIISQESQKKHSKILLLGDVHLEIEEQLKRLAPHLHFEILAS